jgi:hypothetical protein
MKEMDVQRGTSPGMPLCRSCSHGSYIRGVSLCDVILICTEFKREMRFEAYECMEYYDGKAARLFAMEEIAWKLNVDKRGRSVGFTPPDKEEEWDSSILG